MKVSAFTFIRNGQILGYPFAESIKSVLPIVDEFIVNVGQSEDDTLKIIKSIKSDKIKIISSFWNEKMHSKGFVYGQQKMIAQFNCSGDWAFYIEGDEVYHENELSNIKKAMQENLHNEKVEALVVDFYHFYANKKTLLDSPGWYRSEARIIRNSIRSYAPDGLFWLVLQKNKVGRYPWSKRINAHCYHYGWVRSEEEMNLKSKKVQKYWGGTPNVVDYGDISQKILKEFNGSHPAIMTKWLKSTDNKIFEPNKNYKTTKKEKKHLIMKIIEKFLGVELSKKHFKILK